MLLPNDLNLLRQIAGTNTPVEVTLSRYISTCCGGKVQEYTEEATMAGKVISVAQGRVQLIVPGIGRVRSVTAALEDVQDVTIDEEIIT